MTHRQPDVIVVGLGGMGGAIVHHLARRRARVLGLDRYDPPHDRGSSHGDTRILREAYFEAPTYVPLVQRARELWRELEEEVGGTLFQRTGVLLVGSEAGPVVQGARTSALAHGVPVETLDTAQVARRFPMFRTDEGMAAVYERDAGVLDVEGCVAAHLVAAEGRGAELRTEERVVGWSSDGEGVEVRTDRGSYRAGALVLAAGPWIAELLPGLPVRVERQVTLWVEPGYAPASLHADHCPTFLFETAGGVFYGIPDLGRGVKVAQHHGGEIAAIDEIGGLLREEDAAPVLAFLERYVPAAAGTIRRGAVCRYTNTADGSFVIDRVPGEERVWAVSACSGHGFKFASAIGEATAELVLEGRRPARIEPFRWPDQSMPSA